MGNSIGTTPDATIAPAMKIEILLAEYVSLREEAMQRDMTLNQAFIGAAIAIVAIVGFMATSVLGGLALFVFGSALVFFTFKMIEYDVKLLSTRLRDIEAQVNALSGEQLMKWETTHGLLAEGYVSRFTYVRDAFQAIFR